ncbi:MAG: DHA2 family efflux MFS transporter permease subunit [Alphaproteobacteria bacterium]|nr:DHA2 family efflux MFS transporter permease subunit [Alphaproteobacteria bacterium]
MGVGMFMAVLDVQVVATSLPTIQAAIAIRPDQMSWIQTAYLIAEVIAIPLTGFLTRRLGMRGLSVAALSLFTLASAGCAASTGFGTLIVCRIVQGLSGGTLIPAVFTAVFVLFPVVRQGAATMLAGVLAVLAPTVGPIVGGWITETFSWHWLFLINVAPGIAAAGLAGRLLPGAGARDTGGPRLDLGALILLAIALASLEIALKQAPERGWLSPPVAVLLAACLVAALGFARCSVRSARPLVELATFADRNFAIGCALSFVLGIGLFGSVYLMPLHLAFVRGHDALEIGEVMLATGLAQLVAAPLAVALERQLDARLLTAAGFALFVAGIAMSAWQTPRTDGADMVWPQIVRGLAIMLCLLPPTRLALGRLAPDRVADASGLFNLMRNLGGAIGLAVIDTVVFGRAPDHAAAIVERLEAGDVDTARFVGIPLKLFLERPPGPPDEATRAILEPMIETAALTRAIDEAWALCAILTAAALLCLPFARKVVPPR